MNGNSEGDHLCEIHAGEEVDYPSSIPTYEEDERRIREGEQARRKRRREGQAIALRRRYREAQAAKVGTIIACPSCGRDTVKTTYHKLFCSNGKTKGRGNCKDSYWNTVRA